MQSFYYFYFRNFIFGCVLTYGVSLTLYNIDREYPWVILFTVLLLVFSIIILCYMLYESIYLKLTNYVFEKGMIVIYLLDLYLTLIHIISIIWFIIYMLSDFNNNAFVDIERGKYSVYYIFIQIFVLSVNVFNNGGFSSILIPKNIISTLYLSFISIMGKVFTIILIGYVLATFNKNYFKKVKSTNQIIRNHLNKNSKINKSELTPTFHYRLRGRIKKK